MLAEVLHHPRASARTPDLSALHAELVRQPLEVGRTGSLHPKLCFYSFPRVSAFTKAASFGVTLGLVLEGEKEIRVDGRTVLVRAGEAVTVTRAGDIEVAITRAPYLGVSLCFCPETVAEALVAFSDAADAHRETADAPAFVSGVEARLVDALRRVVVASADPTERKVLVPLAEREVLFHLLRSPAAAALRTAVGHGEDRERILSAMQYIRANARQRLSVARIAQKVAMSPSHFAHRFRDVARTTPMRYLREVRLEAARTLLASGRRVSEVAIDVGFDSPSHFTREFKRRYGQSPSELRG